MLAGAAAESSQEKFVGLLSRAQLPICGGRAKKMARRELNAAGYLISQDVSPRRSSTGSFR